MIEVESLTKRYGRATAVDGISFRVEKGEILGFLGPNGAGKTTTMRILTCYLPPTEGTARVGGYDVFSQPMEVKRRVGYLPESPPLYPDMTVEDYLGFCAKIKGVPSKQRQTRVAEAIEKCWAADVRSKLIGKLSKGYRQRVGLAQAILHNPDVLILDEPTAGLDPKQIIETRELIRGLGGDHTVILSTHILPEVQATCGRVIIIHEGKLVADGSPDELAHKDAANSYSLLVDPGDASVEAVRQKLTAIGGVASVREGPGEDGACGWNISAEGDRDLRRELFSCVRDNDWVLLELQRQTASLEDVFRKLTRE
jgi:ABC-2 type transport system ATP-binding protein